MEQHENMINVERRRSNTPSAYLSSLIKRIIGFNSNKPGDSLMLTSLYVYKNERQMSIILTEINILCCRKAALDIVEHEKTQFLKTKKNWIVCIKLTQYA